MSDPTGTIMLRRSFTAEANRRLAQLRSLTHAMLVEHDMMGAHPMAALLGQPGHRLGAFAEWFERTAGEQLTGTAWWERFLERSYESGAATGGELVGRPPRSHAPVPAVYRELAQREFAGIAAAMAQQVARAAAGAAVAGRKPLPLYQQVLAVLRSVGQPRLKAAVNYMTVQLHNAARLAAFAAAGVTQVAVVPERLELARPSRFLRRKGMRDYNECHDPHTGEFCGPGGDGGPKEADDVKTTEHLQKFADPSLPPDTPGNHYYYHSPRYTSELEDIAKGGLRPGSYLSRDEIRDRGTGFVIVRTSAPLPESKDVVEVGLTYRQWRTPDKIPAGDVVRVVRAVPIGGGHTIREDELAQHALENQGSTDPDVQALPEKYRKWYRLAARDGFADVSWAEARRRAVALLARQRAAAEEEAAAAQVAAEQARAALEREVGATLAAAALGEEVMTPSKAEALAELQAAQETAAAQIEAAKAATAAREVEAAAAWEKVKAARRAERAAGHPKPKPEEPQPPTERVVPPGYETVEKVETGTTTIPQRLLKVGARYVNSQTAEDDRVCIVCQEISDDGPYTLAEAQGLLPAHVNCRCAWVPAFDMRYIVNRRLAGEEEVAGAE